MGNDDKHTGSASAEIRFGENDEDSSAANAVVWVKGESTKGSGTLLTDSLVLSAGHVIRHGTTIRGWDSGLPCSDKEVPGRWYRAEEEIEIRIGLERDTPRQSRKAVEYAIPGCADIILLRLDEPVPPDDALPAKVLTSLGGSEGGLDAARLDGEHASTLRMSGWGGHATRQIGRCAYARSDTEKMYFDGSWFTITQGGDSGGPLFWRDLVIGVLQGETGDLSRYTPTFRREVGGKPSVGEWFREIVPSAVYGDEAIEPPAGTTPLLSWDSGSGEDHYSTASPEWIGGRGAIRVLDTTREVPLIGTLDEQVEYRFFRAEGFVFNPALPQPPGTIPLDTWYSVARGDHYTTSHPRWIRWPGDRGTREPSYTFVRREGFVFDPDRERPTGTVPLHGWYSPQREDNRTTTVSERTGREGIQAGFDGPPHLMGYVFPPHRSTRESLDPTVIVARP